MMRRVLLPALSGLLALCSEPARAQQVDLDALIGDLTIVEAEEAAAKEVRLKWISEERTRLRAEMREYEGELTKLREILPDPVKPRAVAPATAVRRDRAEQRFNEWAAENDPVRNNAVFRGTGLNAMLRILGPVAHYRVSHGRSGVSSGAGGSLTSLSPGNAIGPAEIDHLVLSPGTASGSTFVVRLNGSPLDIRWPTVLREFWPDDCRGLEKLRDNYVAALGRAERGEFEPLLDAHRLFDDAAAVLMAKILKKKEDASRKGSASVDTALYFRLQDGLRYLETLRATADRFKEVPADFKVRAFAGGSVEELLDYCYTHGMHFEPARPGDREAYMTVFRRMQDYARDVQYVEDWKADVERRIDELDATDKALVWAAAAK